MSSLHYVTQFTFHVYRSSVVEPQFAVSRAWLRKWRPSRRNSNTCPSPKCHPAEFRQRIILRSRTLLGIEGRSG
jgi:hypothetical protein